VHPKKRGPGGSRRSSEPGSKIAFPADPSSAEDTLRCLRLQRGSHHLHRLGVRALFEFLDELGREYLVADAIERKLAEYGHLDPKTLRAVGGDRFPPRPLHLVRP